MCAYVRWTWPIGAQHPFLSHLVSSSPAEAAKKEMTFAWTLAHVFYDLYFALHVESRSETEVVSLLVFGCFSAGGQELAGFSKVGF